MKDKLFSHHIGTYEIHNAKPFCFAAGFRNQSGNV
jgi:hypothetical protein